MFSHLLLMNQTMNLCHSLKPSLQSFFTMEQCNVSLEWNKETSLWNDRTLKVLSYHSSLQVLSLMFLIRDWKSKSHISKGLLLLTSFYSPPSICFFHVKKVLHMNVLGDVQPTWASLGQFFNGNKLFKVFNILLRSSWGCYGNCNVKNLLTFILSSIIPIICWATNSI
jgi:hypothetical protein